MRTWCLFMVAAGLLLSARAVEAQEPESVRCYALDIEHPAVLHMLGREVQGEVLVLTSEPLEKSPGVTEGSRAYLGIEQWKRDGPLRPLSWYWLRQADNAIRVGFVLPLWGITWTAEETAAGLAGQVTYQSDAVGQSPRTSRFQGARVRCDPGSRIPEGKLEELKVAMKRLAGFIVSPGASRG